MIISTVDGGWSDYGDWSECSAACGGGTQTRSRTCTNLAPTDEGVECEGDAEQEQACNTDPCAGIRMSTTSRILYICITSLFSY